jgi:hypothetical protein
VTPKKTDRGSRALSGFADRRQLLFLSARSDETFAIKTGHFAKKLRAWGVVAIGGNAWR